ncbi:MAG: DegT/DnrJ/EryC1/StrS family aminotransferase [Nitrospinota bacterium]|nr:DegT/DnrJ/EryC1/StrS family aminotransferase [Nitrospinota bacterium]
MSTRLFISGEVIDFFFNNSYTELDAEELIQKLQDDKYELWSSNFILIKSSIENTPDWAKKIIASATICNLKPNSLIKYLEKKEISDIKNDEIRICNNINQAFILTLEKGAWKKSGLNAIELSEISELKKKEDVPLVDLIGQYSSISFEINEAISNTISRSNFVMGEEVLKFEEEFANFCNVKHFITTGSGTDAIHLGLRALGIKKGDGVLTVSHTFFATAESIIMCGGVPFFIDINPKNYCISIESLEKFIQEQCFKKDDGSLIHKESNTSIKSILPVHLYGHPAEIEKLIPIAKENNLTLIGDGAQSHGSKIRINNKFRDISSLCDGTAFSFYPGKNLGAFGDGGGFATNDSELAKKIRLLKDHGRTNKYEHTIYGWSSRLDAIQCSILRVKLKYLEEWTIKRRKAAEKYNELLKKVDQVICPISTDDYYHVYHLYVIRVHENKRDELINFLRENKIFAGIHYPIPLHLQPAFENIKNNSTLPNTEIISKQVLSLPLFPEINFKQQKLVTKKIQEFLC